jgi:integrase
MSITIRSVSTLRPGETIWDAAVKGFGARRQRRDPVYVIKYRVFGRQRFVTIGRHGTWTPDRARREAKRLLGLVAAGRDPQAEKIEARDRAADTLGRVAGDYLQAARKKQTPRTFVETERHLLVNWKPLHPVSIFHLRRRQVAHRLAEIEVKRGAVTAARARAALNAMFNWAIRQGYEVQGNPVAGTNRPNEPKSRDRVLTDAELAAIWRACQDDYGRIVRLLILTGQRRDEVGGMRWSEIDGDLWTIPGSRTKNHRDQPVPLTAPALAIIGEPVHGRDHLFGRGSGFSGWSQSKARLDARLGLAPWRLHDIRRTVATGMAELGVLPHVIETVLNHVSGHKGSIAGVYNRAKYEAPVREALDRWADHIGRLDTAIDRQRLIPIVGAARGQ